MTTNHNFDTAWRGTFPNQGVTSGGCHPIPLRDPYILWDTRNFQPTEYEVYSGGVFPGPLNPTDELFNSSSVSRQRWVYWGPLFNEGTAGSVWDLHAYYSGEALPSIGSIMAGKYKHMFPNGELLTNYHDLGTEWPDDWDDYDGEPCDAPFVCIYGLGHLGRDEDWFHYSTTSWNDSMKYEEFGDFRLDEIVEGERRYENFADFYMEHFNVGVEFAPVDPDWTGTYAELNNEILTVMYDPRCQESYVWVGTRLVMTYTAGDDRDAEDELGFDIRPSLTRWLDYNNSTQDCREFALNDEEFEDFYTEFHAHDAHYENDGSDYELGTAWTGIVGIAKFRGTPSLEDLLYWQEYFRAPAPFTRLITETTTAVTDTEEIYPNPYRYQYTGAVQYYTVPPCVTDIRITCWGGGRPAAGFGGAGGMAEAEFTVTPGDVFEVYVGERTSFFAHGGTWPNGGGNNNGNNNEGESGAGSSHVIPLGGTFTDALVVGGGGGGVNDLGGSRDSVVEGVTAGDGGYPAGTDGNGPDGPDDGIEWGGRGGDQTTGGAVGVTTNGSGDATPGDNTGQGFGGFAAGSGNFFHFAGGGGGGGWHGGGGAGFPRLKGGGSYAGDGGGGSSYTAPSGTNANYSNGIWYGHGMVEILALHDPEVIGC